MTPPDEVGAVACGLETDSVLDLLTAPPLVERGNRPGWRHLLALSQQLPGFPKGFAAPRGHAGEFYLAHRPDAGAAFGHSGPLRSHWDKDSVDDAGVLKIDLLTLGARIFRR